MLVAFSLFSFLQADIWYFFSASLKALVFPPLLSIKSKVTGSQNGLVAL